MLRDLVILLAKELGSSNKSPVPVNKKPEEVIQTKTEQRRVVGDNTGAEELRRRRGNLFAQALGGPGATLG